LLTLIPFPFFLVSRRGLDIWVENCAAGRHRVRLQVTETGLTGTATSEIDVPGGGPGEAS
jgi:hypothetical protein